MNLRTLLSSLIVASMGLSLAACGDVESSSWSAPSNTTVVGTWLNVNNNPQVASTLVYGTDGTFTITGTVTMSPTAMTLAGCVARSITTGRYTVTGASLTQSETTGTASREGCANPGDNLAPSPRDPDQLATFNRTFTYALEGNTLRLTTAMGTTVRYNRP